LVATKSGRYDAVGFFGGLRSEGADPGGENGKGGALVGYMNGDERGKGAGW